MKQILKGYASLFREALGLPNDGSFLVPPAHPLVLILICGALGLVRNAISAGLHVLPGFYGFKADILWTMFAFPPYLFLFTATLLHLQLRWLGQRDLDVQPIFGLAFNLQVLHLIIPFLDWAGHQLGMPWDYVFGPRAVSTEWYTNRIYLTPGIIVAWWITAYAAARVLRRRLGVGWFAIIATSISTFIILAIPKDIFFPALNTLFSRAFGRWLWGPLDYIFMRPRWFPFWGYGTFFALCSLLGLVYWLRSRSKEGV